MWKPADGARPFHRFGGAGPTSGPEAPRVGAPGVKPAGGGGFDPHPVHVNGQPDAELYRLAPVPERPLLGERYAAECLWCLREDPYRVVGQMVAGGSREEAIRLMSNHQAQRHDILPRDASPRSIR